MITTLIDKTDTSELVRDRIAQILADETVAQQALAVAAGEDPAQWALDVYSERANPWGQFQDAPATATPVINVWFDTDSFAESRGNTIKTQTAMGTFNVDCYGYGVTSDTTVGDAAAALEAQRAARLCRNILMASIYTYLGFPRGAGMLVSKRWLQSRTAFQPQQDNQNHSHVAAVRLSFGVEYNENSPQFEATVLEYVATEFKRTSDGLVVARADFDYTTP